MLNITFQVTDAAKVAQILAIMGGPDASVGLPTNSALAPVEEKEKKTRAKKDEPASPVAEQPQAATPEPAAAAPAAPKEDIRKRITEKFVALVGAPGGNTLGAKLLGEFGAARFRDLKDEQLADFEAKIDAQKLV